MWEISVNGFGGAATVAANRVFVGTGSGMEGGTGQQEVVAEKFCSGYLLIRCVIGTASRRNVTLRLLAGISLTLAGLKPWALA